MIRIAVATCAALAASVLIAASTSGASAYQPRCGNCGPIAPAHYSKTLHPAKYSTRYRDVSVVRHVDRVRRIYTVTKIQPIVHVREVTRVHHHTIVHTRNAFVNRTQYLTPIRYVQRSVQNYYDCRCAR